jgi:hypothetical protein
MLIAVVDVARDFSYRVRAPKNLGLHRPIFCHLGACEPNDVRLLSYMPPFFPSFSFDPFQIYGNNFSNVFFFLSILPFFPSCSFLPLLSFFYSTNCFVFFAMLVAPIAAIYICNLYFSCSGVRVPDCLATASDYVASCQPTGFLHVLFIILSYVVQPSWGRRHIPSRVVVCASRTASFSTCIRYYYCP